jgi:hypothetical protein
MRWACLGLRVFRNGCPFFSLKKESGVVGWGLLEYVEWVREKGEVVKVGAAAGAG